MLIDCEGEEAFFDASDHFMSDDVSVVVKESWDYDIWLSEPKSVSERRETFLTKMGFSERSNVVESEMMGSERITENIDDDLLSERRRSNSEANCSVDYSDQDWLDSISIEVQEERQYEMESCLGGSLAITKKKKKTLSWLRSFTKKMKKHRSKLGDEVGEKTRMRIEHNRKRYMECSAVYVGQEFKAHDGLIWTMKFSPDGQYLASGGEDGMVCVWRVTMVDSAPSDDQCSYKGIPSPQTNKSAQASIVIPERIFHLQEEPVRKFKHHRGDVLDLAWSKSNHLLSSSMDKTVRLWNAESDECLGVFHHSNYVTCVQFNPVDDGYFISGCIDGKVRVWGIPKRRVHEWSNVQDIITAVCYQPNGKGFVVGTFSGNCHFYESSGDELLLTAEINIQRKRKSSGNKITGIQFLNDSQTLMIASADSKIRILDGLEVVRKYRGLAKSGSQTSASFTSSGRHIVSIGEDSRVYIWNHDDLCIQTHPKQAKSTRSCESFFTKGVSVVLPWSDSDKNLSCTGSSPTSVLSPETSPRACGSDRFSLVNWFSMDSSCSTANSMTWPEEKLPLWDPPCTACGDHFHQRKKYVRGSTIQSSTWGLVFVTANWDGTIRTFHNYGLPLRV